MEPTTYDASVRATAFATYKKYVPTHTLRDLQRKNSYEGATQLVAHISLIVLFGSLQYALQSNTSTIGVAGYWVSLLSQSMCMAFLFTGFHELTHLTVFTQPVLNKIFGHLFGFTIFRPFNHYIFYHYNHHKFTGDPNMDPELQDSFIDIRIDNIFAYLFYLSGVAFWIDRVTTIIRHNFSLILQRERKYLTNETVQRVIIEAKVYIAVYAFLGGMGIRYPHYGELLLQLWIVPSLIAQPFLRFYLIAEHHGCPVGDNMLSNTRTTTTYGWYRWLAWQMPYHAEHHAFPFVPFHQLDSLHKVLAANVEVGKHRRCEPNGESGYVGVHVQLVKKFFKS